MTDANWNADLDFDDVVRATMTDADKLVEEIARAICAAEREDYDRGTYLAREVYQDQARAALALAVERCAEVGAKAWPRAHTYASENADLYRRQDHAAVTVIKAILALSPNAKGET